MIPYAKIEGATLSFLASTRWVGESQYRWLDQESQTETVKTLAELNDMGYWPVEFSNPPDFDNQYIPVWGLVDSNLVAVSWDRLPPSTDYIAQAAALSFVKESESGVFDDTTIFEHKLLFVTWHEGWTGKQNQIVQESVGGVVRLYRSRHDILTPAQNTRPSETPSMWQEIGDPTEEYPAWSQPLGAGDEYGFGAKVSYAGKRWISTAGNNVWVPGQYGWDEVT